MKKIKGFSLVEVLVVVSIISILAGAAVPIYRDRIVKARVSAHLVPAIYA